MVPGDEISPEEFMDDLQPSEAPKEPKMSKAGGRKVKKSLVEGQVGEISLRPETVTQPKTRLVKVLSVTRTPDQKIASFELRVKDGTLYEVEIDEATSRAITSVFDEL